MKVRSSVKPICEKCKIIKIAYVATNPHEKAVQRALIRYRNPKSGESGMKRDQSRTSGSDRI